MDLFALIGVVVVVLFIFGYLDSISIMCHRNNAGEAQVRERFGVR